MNFCFDIDNTLLFTEYNDGVYTVKQENKELISMLNLLKLQGHTIILHTGRHWNHIKVTKMQIEEAGISYDSLVMGKPVSDFYIDDRAVRPDECIKLLKNILEVKSNG